MSEPIHIFNLTREDMLAWLKELELPAYRANQILQWIYGGLVTDWQQMTNLSAELRRELADYCRLYCSQLVRTLPCPDGTQKLLLQWQDQRCSETVAMQEDNRGTACLSTQVGCPVGCRFCASGSVGLERSLTTGEIVEQAMRAAAALPPGQRLSHIVIMGMGEPFANYDATLKAMRILNAEWGLNIAARHITVSTVGLPDKIRQFAAEPFQFTLAVSLHAADNGLRAELVPWAARYRLGELFDAIDYYYDKTHREVTLEYVLLDGVNTSRKQAEQLVELIGESRCNVNLINYNPTPQSPYRPAAAVTVRDFLLTLQKRGVNVHMRKSKGGSIDAACGQLRLTALQGPAAAGNMVTPQDMFDD